MQGLTKRVYVVLTHTIYHVYTPKDCYYTDGCLLGNIVLDQDDAVVLPKRNGMVQIEWPP